MGVLVFVLLLAVIYGIAALAPTWIVTGERPTERPREWPHGVQEPDAASYEMERMAPRPPPERMEPVATSRLGPHVSIRDP